MASLEQFVAGCESLHEVFSKAVVEETKLRVEPFNVSRSGFEVLSARTDFALVRVVGNISCGITGYDAIHPYGASIYYTLVK